MMTNSVRRGLLSRPPSLLALFLAAGLSASCASSDQETFNPAALVAASRGEEVIPDLAAARAAPRILVLPLADRAVPDRLGRIHNAVDDLIRRDLTCLRNVAVFPNGALPVPVEALYSPEYRRLQTALDAGARVGATHVLIGEVARLQEQVAIEVDVVDVAAARVDTTVRLQDVERRLARRLPQFRLSILQQFDPTITEASATLPGVTPDIAHLQHCGHAQNQAGLGDYSQALIDYYAASGGDLGYADAFVGIAETHLTLGAPEQAERAYLSALTADPRHVEAYWRFGLMRVRTGRGDRTEALALVQQASRRAPFFGQAHITLGTLWFEEKQYEHADAHFLVAAALLPRSLWPHFNHAHVLWVQGDVDGARAEFERAAELGRREPRVHADWGMLLREGGEDVAALRRFRIAAELDKQNPLYLYYVGEQYDRLGDPNAALIAYKAAAAFSFSHPWLHRKLAEAFVRADLYTDAERTLAAGYAGGVRDPQHVLLYARVLLERGQRHRIRRLDYTTRARRVLEALMAGSLTESEQAEAEALAARAAALMQS